MTPVKRIEDDRQWLIKHLTPLMEMGREIQAFDKNLPAPPPTYGKGYWTGLKLILIRYYMPPYLNILARERKVAYVDLFAGPGLNSIGADSIPVPGSPLLPWAIKGTRHSFDCVMLCELNGEYAAALESRVRHYDETNRVYLHEGDANEFVDQLPSLLAARGIKHSLVFIDPEGFKFRYRSMERLVSQIDCDLIINFQSAELTRNLTTHEPETAATIRTFLGLGETDALPEDEESSLETYRRKLAQLGKNVSTEIEIRKGDGPFHYHLIPAVKSTRGGSRWFKIFEDVKRRIERLQGDALGVIAAQIEKRQQAIDDHLA